MNTSIRARHAARGFSFVELLVTIVIAGIAFAAMVPLFASAQQKASGDQMRNIALNVAQDRIEKIRALSYSQIAANKNTPNTTPNLYNPSWMGGQFGPSYTATSGAGGSKVFTVDCTVTEVGSGTTVYKKIDVDVYWTAPPTPVKHAKLTTFVAKQYAGPQTTNLGLSPMSAGNVTGKPVVITATVAPDDVNSMAVNGSAKGKVIFYVFSAVNGAQVATFTVNTGDLGNTTAGTYTASWDAAAAADGDYSFRAQAYSTSGDPGNIWQRTAAVILTGAPPRVIGLTASPGDGRAILSWTACTASDFDHYEVWMGSAPGAESQVALDPRLTANGYTKYSLTNDETYYFVVYAVDTDGKKSPASDEVSVTPTSMPGVNRPSTPGSFAAVPTFNTAALTWTASVQDVTSTLAGYYIYRDGGMTPFAMVGAALHWEDTVGWTSTHTYSVRAYNAAGRQSVATATLSVTTGVATKHDLTVKNTRPASGSIILVWVQSTTTGLWWLSANPSTSTSTKPAGKSIAKKGGTEVWNQLPYDTYTVSTGGGLWQTLNPAITPSVSFDK